jgi:pimeloyl-ACP methyl ester carboxylesterase
MRSDMASRTRVGALRAYWRNYVRAPQYSAAQHHDLRSEDGVALHAVALKGPPGCGGTVLVVPGFGHWGRHAKIVEFAHALAEHANVIVVELRGHGRSQGESRLGAVEYRDVAAAAGLVAEQDAFVLVGISMGSAASVVYAATAAPGQRRADALVSISGPAWWTWERPQSGVDKLLQAANSGLMRWGMRAFMRVRVAPVTDVGWRDPIDLVAALGPIPIVFVHDRRDWYFGVDQVEAMRERAGDTAEIWWRDGGHATDLLTPALYDELVHRVITPVARASSARPSTGPHPATSTSRAPR